MKKPKTMRVRLPDGEVIEAIERPGYIDLDKEVILRADRTRYTSADAEADVEYILDKLGRGKPSLSGRGKSPQIGVRLPVDLRERLAQRAVHEGRRESELVRDALEAYLSA